MYGKHRLLCNHTSLYNLHCSQLNGKALKWADSIWSQHGAVTQSYSAFISHFREVFGKPLTDSSAGEKLYNLKQGAMSIYDYALQFRTLAAVCGWNEQALITTYRQGLEPRVRLQLAACEDTIGLEKFIQHSIRCATLMQACLQEHQDQFLSIASLCRSEPVSSPEPANEPMDVENSRLTSSERQRRLTLHLCLYCGAPGHIISACPIRPPRPMVSAIIPSLKKMKPLSTVVNLTAADVSITVVALLDSGSAGNFISGALCRQLRLKTSPSPTVYQINSITGRPLSHKQVRRIGHSLRCYECMGLTGSCDQTVQTCPSGSSQCMSITTVAQIEPVLNGKKCYSCDGQSCSNTVSCSGTEDRCVKATATFGGQSAVVKGCVSKSICDATTSVSDYASISCCEGNLCNGAQSVSQSFLFLCCPLLSYFLLH
ncbi:Retrotransposon-derived protein PEG10 [Anabarilius grahami]|uniref:Retrotransposon-derived protein PEG10 n=1 Tax=Anabarilius grahami TaxID=495550 RepID=A0A3N0YVT3_ANAGA|nr:Retrotransposon-derived protein PEG10 [Anabarilius grahami]